MILSRTINFKKSCMAWTAIHNRKVSLLPKYYNDFQDYLPKVVEKCLVNNKHTNFVDFKQHITNLSEYHTLARDPIQGNLALHAFHWLANPDDLTEQNLHQIKVLAWAIELVQSYFIISDDVEDSSKMRFGKLCWHLQPGVGFMALNDTSLLRSFIYEILRNNIDDTLFIKMNNYFNEAFLTLNLAQHLDITMSQSKDYNKFSMDHYEKCANLKFGYYTIKFPILVALALCNKDSEESYKLVDDIFTDLGILSQIENDLMDYIGYKSQSGKTSSDIQKRKCSWPALVVLHHGNEQQRRVFESCYGRWEPENVKRILDLYKELNLLDLYRQEEYNRYQAVNQKINALPKDSIPSPQFCRQVVEFIQHNVTNIDTPCS